MGERPGSLRCRLEGEGLLDARDRQAGEAEEVVLLLQAAEPARLAGVVREEGEGDELRREGLRRGDADLGPRVRREDARRRGGRDRRAGDVRHHGRGARALRVGQGGDGCRRLAQLGQDPEDERPGPDEVLPVAELRGSRPRPGRAGDPQGGTSRRGRRGQLVPQATTTIRSTSERELRRDAHRVPR